MKLKKKITTKAFLNARRCHIHHPKYMGASHAPSGVVHASVLFNLFF